MAMTSFLTALFHPLAHPGRFLTAFSAPGGRTLRPRCGILVSSILAVLVIGSPASAVEWPKTVNPFTAGQTFADEFVKFGWVGIFLGLMPRTTAGGMSQEDFDRIEAIISRYSEQVELTNIRTAMSDLPLLVSQSDTTWDNATNAQLHNNYERYKDHLLKIRNLIDICRPHRWGGVIYSLVAVDEVYSVRMLALSKLLGKRFDNDIKICQDNWRVYQDALRESQDILHARQKAVKLKWTTEPFRGFGNWKIHYQAKIVNDDGNSKHDYTVWSQPAHEYAMVPERYRGRWNRITPSQLKQVAEDHLQERHQYRDILHREIQRITWLTTGGYLDGVLRTTIGIQRLRALSNLQVSFLEYDAAKKEHHRMLPGNDGEIKGSIIVSKPNRTDGHIAIGPYRPAYADGIIAFMEYEMSSSRNNDSNMEFPALWFDINANFPAKDVRLASYTATYAQSVQPGVHNRILGTSISGDDRSVPLEYRLGKRGMPSGVILNTRLNKVKVITFNYSSRG